MADEAIKEGGINEGTIEAEVIKTEGETPKVDILKADKVSETVPLAVYLELKDDMKSLKEEVKNSRGSEKNSVQIQGLEEIANKYPDVNREFIQDLLGSATKEATKKIEEKYNPIIEKAENERKQEVFNKAFDSLYEKTIKDLPGLPSNIDKELIKELAITPKYRNVPLVDILNKMYSKPEEGKDSSENDTRNGSDVTDEVVSFDRITPEQRKVIMEDPKARHKYFTWLDKQV